MIVSEFLIDLMVNHWALYLSVTCIMGFVLKSPIESVFYQMVVPTRRIMHIGTIFL